jgi:hypothetical protein
MIDETEDYWIYCDYLVFKPSFNKELNNNYTLLSRRSKIIFSNYNNPFRATFEKNQYNSKYDNDFNGSKFNCLINLPNSTTHIIFGHSFNKPINLPNSLIYLSFGEHFKQLVNLPTTIKHLSFGKNFDCEVNLPLGLKYLKLNSNNEYIINNLVNTIEELELGCNFNLKLNNLPNSIKKIIFNNYNNDLYDKDLNSLVDTIEFIQLPLNYNKKIIIIPKSLKVIKCHYNYPFANDYEKNIHIEIIKN